MFKGSTTFSYSGGTASASNGWSYSIKAAFLSQQSLQPQYKTLTQPQITAGGIPQGAYFLANMAIGVADDDYRAKYGTIPGTNLSEFGQWVDENRQPIWNDAAGWFAPSEGSGGGGGSGGNGGNGGSPPPDAGFFSSLGTMGIVAAVALAALLLLKR